MVVFVRLPPCKVIGSGRTLFSSSFSRIYFIIYGVGTAVCVCDKNVIIIVLKLNRSWAYTHSSVLSVYLYTRNIERGLETWRLEENAFKNHCGKILILFLLVFSRAPDRRDWILFSWVFGFLCWKVCVPPCAILSWAQAILHTPPGLSKRRINDNNRGEKSF